MYRYVQVTVALCIAAVGLAGRASAQTAGDRPISVQFNAGWSLGNHTSGTWGLEGDYVVNSQFQLFAEFAQMLNVAPSFIDDRANAVAGAIGGTAEAKDKANLFDIGAKYRLAPYRGYQPYVGMGIGAANISKDTTFTVNGAELTEEQLLSDYGVQLGNDLAGSTTKAAVIFMGGVSRPFMERYSLEVSYRYGYIFPKSSVIEDDKGISTNRLQFGVAMHF